MQRARSRAVCGRSCVAGNDGVVCAPAQGALVAALALSLAPEGDAFVAPGALRVPGLRTGAAATASRPARRGVTAPRMSDLSDMTLEMLKRVEKTLDELDDITLARVSCARPRAPAPRAARARAPSAACQTRKPGGAARVSWPA